MPSIHRHLDHHTSGTATVGFSVQFTDTVMYVRSRSRHMFQMSSYLTRPDSFLQSTSSVRQKVTQMTQVLPVEIHKAHWHPLGHSFA